MRYLRFYDNQTKQYYTKMLRYVIELKKAMCGKCHKFFLSFGLSKKLSNKPLLDCYTGDIIIIADICLNWACKL